MSQAEIVSSAAGLSEATCRELFDLVLRASALSPLCQPPADYVACLRELAGRDANLEACLKSHSLPNDWGSIAQHLPELLIKHSAGWLHEIATHDQVQLLSLCHVINRLRTVEARFATELEHQKMEAIYQFAYGLSHELNNPLANIATRAGVLARDEPHKARRQLLESIIGHAMRGCEMLGDLMLVARPPQLHFEATRVDQLLDSLLERARLWATELNIELLFESHSQTLLEVDATALTEALWAIIRNAMEAMPDGGEISITLDNDRCADHKHAQPPGIVIEVADRGSGLSQVALEHCFDPYYSGREAGRGLGLGLSKAKRIVDLHHGQLTLSNRPGGGCLARILLPTKTIQVTIE